MYKIIIIVLLFINIVLTQYLPIPGNFCGFFDKKNNIGISCYNLPYLICPDTHELQIIDKYLEYYTCVNTNSTNIIEGSICGSLNYPCDNMAICPPTYNQITFNDYSFCYANGDNAIMYNGLICGIHNGDILINCDNYDPNISCPIFYKQTTFLDNSYSCMRYTPN